MKNLSVIIFPFFVLSLAACNSGGGLTTPITSSETITSSSSSEVVYTPVDYTLGRTMNTSLGRGINFGNSWDSIWEDALDDGWNNPIQDEWFSIIKTAGFNSVRIPVRWSATADSVPPYTLQVARLEGVMADVLLANAQGMPAVINIHHFNELINAADSTTLAVQKEKFLYIWSQIASYFKDVPNNALAFEFLNEANNKVTFKVLNELITNAYSTIRETNPGRTLIINPGDYGHFEALKNLRTEGVGIPVDGNMILSGHYYEPYTFSHQGHGDYDCGGIWEGTSSELKAIDNAMASFVDDANKYFPDIDGSHIPMNMGEFGASSACTETTNVMRGNYIATVARAAEAVGMSWHYWGFTGVQFDAYDKTTSAWIPEVLTALIPQ